MDIDRDRQGLSRQRWVGLTVQLIRVDGRILEDSLTIKSLKITIENHHNPSRILFQRRLTIHPAAYVCPHCKCAHASTPQYHSKRHVFMLSIDGASSGAGQRLDSAPLAQSVKLCMMVVLKTPINFRRGAQKFHSPLPWKQHFHSYGCFLFKYDGFTHEILVEPLSGECMPFDIKIKC